MSPESGSNAARPLTSTGPSLSAEPNGVSGGEPQSPGQAYERYFEVVWRNLRRLGVAESALEDAAQDVFIVVHRRWADFEGRSSLKTWVIGICLHIAKQHLRRGARAAREQAAIDENQAAPGDVAHDLERRQAAQQLMSTLDQMTQPQRAILVLVELEELTVAEAAEAMKIPASTAYKRLQQAHRVFEQLWLRQVARDEWRVR